MEHIYLSHHGIKGQKWGVRRFQLKNGRLTAAGKKRYAEDDDEQKKKGEEESKPKVKSISEMSDDELRAKINRIRLENEYKQYVSGPQQQKTSDGKKFVMDATKRLLLEPAINAGSKAMNDKLNKVLSEYVNGTPKTIKELKEMDIDKMSDKDLTRLATRLNDENRVKESRRVANDKDATLRLLKDTKTEDLTGDQLKSVLDRVTNENKLEKARKGEVTGMSKDEVTELVERLMEEKLNHSDMNDVEDFLEHHGIKGQRWGVRRFQKKDGTLTPAGKKRYVNNDSGEDESVIINDDLRKGEYYSSQDKPKKFKTSQDVSDWSELEGGNIRDRLSYNEITEKEATKLWDALAKQTDVEFRRVDIRNEAYELSKQHADALTKYVKTNDLKQRAEIRKELDPISKQLREKTKEYLDSLPYDEAKRLIDFDDEHGGYIADAKMFYPETSYENSVFNRDMIEYPIYITDPGTGRNDKYEEILKHSAVLEHHGIKGQKWGVRRFQRKDGTLTPAGEKRYSDDDEVLMKKGETGSHVSGIRRIKLRENETYLYDPNNEHDRSVYEGAYAKYLQLGKGYCKQYIHEYKFKEDLVSPSEKKRVDLFIESYRNNPVLYSDSLNYVKNSYKKLSYDTLTDKNKNIASYKKEFNKTTSDRDLRKYGYDTFTAMQEYGSRVPAVQVYYDKVKDLGYNAIVDDNNRSVYNDAVKPFIVLNGKKTLKELDVVRLTKQQQWAQEKELREYMRKKYGKDNIAL